MARPKGSKNKSTLAKETKIVAKPRVFVEEAPVTVADSEVEYIATDRDEAEESEDAMDTPDTVIPDRRPAGMVPLATAMPLLDSRDQAIINALTSIMPMKQVPYHRYKTRSKFNPTGRRRELGCSLYQNGYRCNVKILTDTEVDLIPRLQSGQFISKLVRVRREGGVGEDDDKVFISYNNKTADQRMMNKDHWRNFGDLLRLCVEEAEARQKQRRDNTRRSLSAEA